MYRIIIAGSKSFTDYDLLKETLDDYLAGLNPDDIEILSGGCRGANKLGEQYAASRGISIKQFLLDKGDQSFYADTVRNENMVSYAAEMDGAVVAFWDDRSRGTEDLIRHARTYMMDVNIIHI